ncbi:hypothetical protein DCO46_16970 [Flavobacterium sp. HTF]|nr:hypothetical protein DCO46_16970 [Flavobacterium sp. HTF]
MKILDGVLRRFFVPQNDKIGGMFNGDTCKRFHKTVNQRKVLISSKYVKITEPLNTVQKSFSAK